MGVHAAKNKIMMENIDLFTDFFMVLERMRPCDRAPFA